MATIEDDLLQRMADKGRAMESASDKRTMIIARFLAGFCWRDDNTHAIPWKDLTPVERQHAEETARVALRSMYLRARR